MKVLLASNMYPSKNFVNFGTFVKKNHDDLVRIGYEVEKVVIDRKVSSTFKKLFSYSKYSLKFIFMNLKDKYDLVYIHYLTHSTLPLIPFLLAKSNFKYVINIHGDDLLAPSNYHSRLSFFNELILSNASLIVLPSPYFKEVLLNKYPQIPENKIFVSYSGGINESFKYLDDLRNKEEVKVFGYVSRLEEGKGWECMLDAVSLISSEIRGVSKFRVYGDGLQKEEFISKISELKLEDIVEYCGVCSHESVPLIMNSFDYFLFPTERESLGLVLLEALACGVPAICSQIRPLTDVVTNECVYNFTVNDHKELSEKILMALNSDKNKYKTMSNNALICANRYKDGRLIGEFKNVLESI